MNPLDLPTPHKRERRKQDRPGELLEAALDLFVEKGFAATRAEEVAVRAGVSKGTLFLYFPSKEELFKAVVMENVARPVAEGIIEAENFTGNSGELLTFSWAYSPPRTSAWAIPPVSNRAVASVISVTMKPGAIARPLQSIASTSPIDTLAGSCVRRVGPTARMRSRPIAQAARSGKMSAMATSR